MATCPYAPKMRKIDFLKPLVFKTERDSIKKIIL